MVVSPGKGVWAAHSLLQVLLWTICTSLAHGMVLAPTVPGTTLLKMQLGFDMRPMLTAADTCSVH